MGRAAVAQYVNAVQSRFSTASAFSSAVSASYELVDISPVSCVCICKESKKEGTAGRGKAQ